MFTFIRRLFSTTTTEAVVNLSDEATAIVEGAVKSVLNKATGDLKEAANLTERVAALRKQVTELEISRDKKQEEFDRRTREVEHMVGLERKRQSFEVEAAKREAVVEVRETNLKEDKQRFADQMDFQNRRFTEEVKYLKDTLAQVLVVVTEVQKAKNRPAKRG